MLLNLTLNELLYLDDGLTVIRDDVDFDPRFSGTRLLAPMAVSAASPELLLKFGSAIVDLTDNDELVPIELDEDELWLIREVSQSVVNYNGESVGINLKRKVYRALRSFYVGEILEELDDLPPVDDSLTDAADKKNKDYLDAYHYLEDDSE